MSTMLMNYEPRVRSSVHWLLGAPAWLQNFKKYLNAIFKELARRLYFFGNFSIIRNMKNKIDIKNDKTLFG